MSNLISQREHYLDKITWEQFERLLVMIMKRKWPITHVTPPGADGGADAISYSEEGNIIAVGQAKHTARVRSPVVDAILGVALQHGATNAVIATSGELTKPAKDKFETNRVQGGKYAQYPNSPFKLYIWERREVVLFLNGMNEQTWKRFLSGVIYEPGKFRVIPKPRRPKDPVRAALVALERQAKTWQQSPKRNRPFRYISLARKSLNELPSRFGESELLNEVETTLYQVEAIQGGGHTKQISTKWDAFLMAAGGLFRA